MFYKKWKLIQLNKNLLVRLYKSQKSEQKFSIKCWNRYSVKVYWKK